MNLVKINKSLDNIVDEANLIRNELSYDPPIEPIITFEPPQRIGKILSNADANILNGYSCWEYLLNGRIRMWYLWQRINPDKSKTNFFLSCTSVDGLSGHWNSSDVENANGNPLQGYGPVTSWKFKGNYYHVYNKPAVNQLVEKRFFKSANGHTWTEYPTSKVWKLGEDHHIFVINQGKPNEELIMLVRPYMSEHPNGNGRRNVSIMRTSDGINWTEPIEIFTSQNISEQYYSMSACQIDSNLYYGCMNVLNDTTKKVSMRVMKSTDMMSWEVLQNISMPADVGQQYGAVSFNKTKNEIDILTLEHGDVHIVNGDPLKRFYLALNKVKVLGL